MVVALVGECLLYESDEKSELLLVKWLEGSPEDIALYEFLDKRVDQVVLLGVETVDESILEFKLFQHLVIHFGLPSSFFSLYESVVFWLVEHPSLKILLVLHHFLFMFEKPFEYVFLLFLLVFGKVGVFVIH